MIVVNKEGSIRLGDRRDWNVLDVRGKRVRSREQSGQSVPLADRFHGEKKWWRWVRIPSCLNV
jgi:hypothetical protein